MGSLELGMGRGKTYPASGARHLLNPLRTVVQRPARVISKMGLRAVDIVLEVGCGPGWFSPSLASSIPEGRLIMCDIQPEMVTAAASRTSNFTNVDHITADATALPFSDDVFDAVLLALVLGEVRDKVGCLREMRRVTADSGSIFVVETRRDSDYVHPRELARVAAEAGLEVRTVWGPRWEYTARLSVPMPGDGDSTRRE